MGIIYDMLFVFVFCASGLGLEISLGIPLNENRCRYVGFLVLYSFQGLLERASGCLGVFTRVGGEVRGMLQGAL